jgi:hypothetical protein
VLRAVAGDRATLSVPEPVGVPLVLISQDPRTGRFSVMSANRRDSR